ncbi:dodecin [Sphingomonas sp. C3-2]|uniref:dodecin n=1 Tax=Sphingomonas sp. C3-2 TaxID=3062169 RepID=UPI00294ACE36|nr:dodecin [Sphingomonas sp. C3-2]WOK35652.1 dodecin family protein [Sphingomonas sp. C3-2]
MSDRVYKITEVVGSSATSIEDAIEKAIARTADTVKHLDWFEVVSTRGHIIGRGVGHYQVTLRIGFTLEG